MPMSVQQPYAPPARILLQAVGEAFDRADAAIEAWQLNTVPEEDEGEEEEEEEDGGEAEPDNTFLTGVGITEPRRKGGKGEAEEEGAGADAAGAGEGSAGGARAVWRDVADPTERLALALGLDPRRLAIYTGLPTADA